MLQHLIIQFRQHYLSTGRFRAAGGLKTNETFKILALKVAAVAYEM